MTASKTKERRTNFHVWQPAYDEHQAFRFNLFARKTSFLELHTSFPSQLAVSHHSLRIFDLIIPSGNFIRKTWLILAPTFLGLASVDATASESILRHQRIQVEVCTQWKWHIAGYRVRINHDFSLKIVCLRRVSESSYSLTSLLWAMLFCIRFSFFSENVKKIWFVFLLL